MTLQNVGNYLISPWFLLALYQSILMISFFVLQHFLKKSPVSMWLVMIVFGIYSLLMAQVILWVLL